MITRPAWQYHAVHLSFAQLPAEKIAIRLGKPEKQVANLLATGWARQQLEAFHAAAVQHAASLAADPIARLLSKADRAAEVLSRAMELAEASEDVEWMVKTAKEVLAHTGYGPTKKTQTNELHVVAQMTDVEQLKRIIQGEKPVLILPPTEH